MRIEIGFIQDYTAFIKEARPVVNDNYEALAARMMDAGHWQEPNAFSTPRKNEEIWL